jgi:hypothetical protein
LLSLSQNNSLSCGNLIVLLEISIGVPSSYITSFYHNFLISFAYTRKKFNFVLADVIPRPEAIW